MTQEMPREIWAEPNGGSNLDAYQDVPLKLQDGLTKYTRSDIADKLAEALEGILHEDGGTVAVAAYNPLAVAARAALKVYREGV